MKERSKPPDGYCVWDPNRHKSSCERRWDWGVQGWMAYGTRDAAVVACWDHHDAVKARGYAECKADVIAKLVIKLTHYVHDGAAALALESAKIAFERDEHVGAAERGKRISE